MFQPRSSLSFRVFSCLPALGIMACSAAPQEVEAPAATPASAAATASAGPGASAAPATTATAEPTATAAAAAASPPAPVSKLVAVSTLPGPSSLRAVDGAVLVVRDEVAEMKPEGKVGIQIGTLDGDRADFSQKIILERWHHIVDVIGTWPGNIEVLATGDTGRVGIAERHRLSGSGFAPVSAHIGSFFVGSANLGSSTVAMQAQMMIPTEVPKIVAVRGPAVSYKVTPADPKSCKDSYQKAAVHPYTFGATGDGTLLSFGRTCSDERAVEAWTAPGKPPTITVLSAPKAPSGNVEDATIVSGVAREAWIIADSLIHFDGTAWKEVSEPAPGVTVVEASAAPDGTLWALTAKGALFALKDGAWRSEPLPSDAAANHVFAAKDGTVWVTTATTLLRTRRPGDGDGVKLDAKDQARPKARRHLSPGSNACTQNVVVLYGFTKVTPDDYDFPLTRKALKGHMEYNKTRFVVTKDGGQKFFAAMVPSFDMGKKLVALIEKEVNGAKPQVVCAEPEIVREVKLDLATGNVVK